MPSRSSSKRHFSPGRSKKRSRKPTTPSLPPIPRNLASVIRGLYRRVSQSLEVDPSYVSRVARGQRRSEAVEKAIRRELTKIVSSFTRGSGRVVRNRTRAKK